MLVNQTLLYSVSNNTSNIRFKLCKNSFIAVWKKAAQGSPFSPNFILLAGRFIYSGAVPHLRAIRNLDYSHSCLPISWRGLRYRPK